ncbi:MAG: hypothetical protein HY303_19700 [Candidatus Wallbacteria bacterium]|nr:hypothetical protein [Candidatus Wallbacteria bacterium]
MRSEASYLRPGPLSALAIAYIAAGAGFVAYGLAGTFDGGVFALGYFVISAGAARALALGFGAGLVLVGGGFWQLRRSAWVVFVSAAWVGLALDLVWLAIGLRQGSYLRFGTCLLVDALLLLYVYSQRKLFTN